MNHHHANEKEAIYVTALLKQTKERTNNLQTFLCTLRINNRFNWIKKNGKKRNESTDCIIQLQIGTNIFEYFFFQKKQKENEEKLEFD